MAITTATSGGTSSPRRPRPGWGRWVGWPPALRALGGLDRGRDESFQQSRDPRRWQPGVERQDRWPAAVQGRGERVEHRPGRVSGREQECVQGPAGHRRKVNRAQQGRTGRPDVIEWKRSAGGGPGIHRHRVRHGRGHREDHDQPARGAQRVPADDPVRALARVQRRPRRPGHRGDHLDRGRHQAFCSGGDQKIRGDDGYIDAGGVGRLNVLDLQVQIRRLPKPVIAMVAGYAIGGGHVLHVCCDLTIAADNAIFGQTGPKVGSFDGGYGSWLLAGTVGLKKAREIWYLCRQYNAQQALEMGLVNTVVPLADLEAETGAGR